MVLSGAHLCGKEFGKMYFRTGIELAVAAHPKDWVFFVEQGLVAEASKRRGVEVKGREELALFSRIAHALDIPFYDPILAIPSEVVVQHVMKAYGKSRTDLAVIFTMASMGSSIHGDPRLTAPLRRMSETKRLEFYNEVIKSNLLNREKLHPTVPSTAEQLNIPVDDLVSALQEFMKPQKGKDEISTLRDNLRLVSEFVEKWGRTSNQLSLARLQRQLRNVGKKKAFFQMGKNHVPLVQNAYQ